MMTQDLPQLLTIDELAHHCRYSVVHIRRLVKKGTIKCLQPAGRRGKLLFRADCFERAQPAGMALEPRNAPTVSSRPIPGPKPKWRGRATSTTKD